MSAICLAISAAVIWMSPKPAQAEPKVDHATPSEKNPQAGHSLHGDAFNEGPRQKAYLMPGMATIRFPVTSQSELARKFFEQGVCQLHGFWHFEAERSFRQAAALDSKFAMAYWGMALANVENEKRARGFIANAVALKPRATAREAAWIDAFDRFYKEKQVDKDRRRKLIRDLEGIVQDFPDEIEAKAFLAWTIWVGSQKGLSISSYQAVDTLIGEVLREQPMHPGAHHYRVHLWDNEKAERALSSAALIGQSAPAIAHQWHMSGHIFSKLKRYDDAAWQQEASARVDHAYMIRDHVPPYMIHNYAHNNQWLATDLAHHGRPTEAVRIARNLVEIPRHPVKNKISEGGSCARMGRDRLLEILPRYEMWDELIALVESNVIEPTETPAEQLKRLKSVGIAYFAKGDIANGDKQIAAIRKLPAPAKAEPASDKSAKSASTEAKRSRSDKPDSKASTKKPDQPAPAKTSNPKEKNEKSSAPPKNETVGENEIKELAAWRLAAEKKPKEAFSSLEKLGIRKTHLARLALAAGDLGKAEKLATEAVSDAANEFDALATKAFVLQSVGKKALARETFEQLRLLGCRAELSLACCKRLEPLAREIGCPKDWRIVSAPKTDIGIRPPLDRLGPVCWMPWASAGWKLTSATGATVGSESFRGRPVVMIFFLGAGCLHCIEQLEKFAPLAADYQRAGISLIAISTDSGDAVQDQLNKASKAKPIPFPVVSDASLTAFRAFRAYDDFEQKPLHGVFLIDANGLVRWQDIGYEPFQDAKFLLEESRRLLAHPSGLQVVGKSKDTAQDMVTIRKSLPPSSNKGASK